MDEGKGRQPRIKEALSEAAGLMPMYEIDAFQRDKKLNYLNNLAFV